MKTTTMELNAQMSDLMRVLVEEANLPTLEDDDITIGRFAQLAGIGTGKATDILRNKVKAGLMQEVACRDPRNGKRVLAFRLAPGLTPDRLREEV